MSLDRTAAPGGAEKAATILTARLPSGIASRHVGNGNGLDMHVLTAGDDRPDRPLALLLHGFPEFAFSWRKIMLPLAEAGWFVVAPDQRGYGLTTGSDDRFDGPLADFRMFNLVRDQLGLLHALGRPSVDLLVGHDFGSPVAAWCALMRPDVFRSVALMSAPFAGPPSLAPGSTPAVDHAGLASLDRPRRHYQWYYSEPQANDDMMNCEQGLHRFLRDYYHAKSADWPVNHPQRLASWDAEELARMPDYYIMGLTDTMPQAVAPARPAQDAGACRWLTDDELAVYVANYASRGFQGGLQWYRCGTGGQFVNEMQLFAGRRIEQPACFIAGRQDWGVWQKPGECERMRDHVCTDMRGFHLVDDAGHWVQQEQPAAVVDHLLDFSRSTMA